MIKLETIITNGYVDGSTMEHFISGGWNFVCTIPANIVHPHACDADKLSIFSKYEEHKVDDSELTLNNSEGEER